MLQLGRHGAVLWRREVDDLSSLLEHFARLSLINVRAVLILSWRFEEEVVEVLG